MRWCLYDGGGRATASAFGAGLGAIGEEFFLLDGDVWEDGAFQACDVGVVFGFRKSQQDTIASCSRRGVPTVVLDLGYTRRFSSDNISPDATVQLSVGRALNLLPPFPCPPDRRVAYGIEYPGDRSRPDGYVLVCGQWPTDPTHPFRGEEAILEWIDSEIKPRCGGREVRYRPHPRLRHPGTPIETDLAGACVVVTWSSNSGHDALLQGVPVVCWDKSAAYAPAAAFGPDMASVADATFPPQEVWEAYFNGLAYGQWSFAELRAGEPQRFVIKLIRGENPFPPPPAVKAAPAPVPPSAPVAPPPAPKPAPAPVPAPKPAHAPAPKPQPVPAAPAPKPAPKPAPLPAKPTPPATPSTAPAKPASPPVKPVAA